MTVWVNWLCLCLLNPLLELFDVWYGIQLYLWSKIKKQGRESLLTQLEANIAMEPYQLSMTTKFSQILNIMFYTSFYVILFPPGIIITLCGLLAQYWLSKFLMINRYKVPKISGEIALYSMQLIGLFCSFLFMISGVVFSALLSKKDPPYNSSIKDSAFDSTFNTSIAVPIVVFLLLTILRYSLKYGKKKNQKSCIYVVLAGDDTHMMEFYDKFKDVEYDRSRFGAANYKTMNPVTRNEGMKELMTCYADKATTEEDKKKYLKMQQNYQASAQIFQNYFSRQNILQQFAPVYPQGQIAVQNTSMSYPMYTTSVVIPQPAPVQQYGAPPPQYQQPLQTSSYYMPQGYSTQPQPYYATYQGNQ